MDEVVDIVCSLRGEIPSAKIGKLFFLLRVYAFTSPGAVKTRGGELMKAYELLFFVAPSIDEESRAATMKRIETAIAAGNGVVDNVDDWGKRKLAFEVEGMTDGDYTLIDFHAEPENIAELDRVLRITDAVARHMIVKRFDRD